MLFTLPSGASPKIKAIKFASSYLKVRWWQWAFAALEWFLDHKGPNGGAAAAWYMQELKSASLASAADVRKLAKACIQRLLDDREPAMLALVDGADLQRSGLRAPPAAPPPAPTDSAGGGGSDEGGKPDGGAPKKPNPRTGKKKKSGKSDAAPRRNPARSSRAEAGKGEGADAGGKAAEGALTLTHSTPSATLHVHPPTTRQRLSTRSSHVS